MLLRAEQAAVFVAVGDLKAGAREFERVGLVVPLKPVGVVALGDDGLPGRSSFSALIQAARVTPPVKSKADSSATSRKSPSPPRAMAPPILPAGGLPVGIALDGGLVAVAGAVGGGPAVFLVELPPADQAGHLGGAEDAADSARRCRSWPIPRELACHDRRRRRRR